MMKVDRQVTDPDQSNDQTPPGLYTPYEEVDKAKYELIHPDYALVHFNVTPRTAYRHIDSGKMPYTIEKGVKKLLKEREQSLSDPGAKNVGQLSVISGERSDKVSDETVMNPTIEKLLDAMPDYKEMLAEKETEIKRLQAERDSLKDGHNIALAGLKDSHTKALEDVRQKHQADMDTLRKSTDDTISGLRTEISDLKAKHQAALDDLRGQHKAEVDGLKKELEAERVAKAKLEEKATQVDTMKSAVEAQKETITTQKTAIDALNNERIVITQQLQKYRVSDSPDKGFKWPWQK